MTGHYSTICQNVEDGYSKMHNLPIWVHLYYLLSIENFQDALKDLNHTVEIAGTSKLFLIVFSVFYPCSFLKFGVFFVYKEYTYQRSELLCTS